MCQEIEAAMVFDGHGGKKIAKKHLKTWISNWFRIRPSRGVSEASLENIYNSANTIKRE